MRVSWWMAAMIVALIALLGAAACGGGGDDDDDDDDDSGDPTNDIKFTELEPASGGQVVMNTLDDGTVFAFVLIDGGDLMYGELGDGEWNFETIRDADGVAYLDWTRQPNGDLALCVADSAAQTITLYTAPGWTAETLTGAAVEGASFRDCSISYEASNGARHLVYSDTAGGLKYRTDENGPWGGANVETAAGDIMSPRLHVDGGGILHVAYVLRDGSNWTVRYAESGSSGFTISDIDAVGPEPALIVSLIDDSDRMIFAFQDFIEKSIQASVYGAAAQTLVPEDAGPDFGFFIAADGTWYVSYYAEGGEDLFYANNADGDWADRSVHTTGDIGAASGIAVDENNKVHLLYFGEGSLWYAVF